MQEGHIADDLKEIAKIWTLHGFGYHGFFKPSVAEVIFQIPPEIISQVDYFCVYGPQDGPEMNLGECKKYFNDCYQVAQTILYKKVN